MKSLMIVLRSENTLNLFLTLKRLLVIIKSNINSGMGARVEGSDPGEKPYARFGVML